MRQRALSLSAEDGTVKMKEGWEGLVVSLWMALVAGIVILVLKLSLG
ncbi:MAG: hypothetical protein HY953_08115 [Candidatus Rokubacteria bacterium]|nr:hypothetical protein [Candidatus Rokubacteria bacterium]